jgi:hypothetical protein
LVHFTARVVCVKLVWLESVSGRLICIKSNSYVLARLNSPSKSKFEFSADLSNNTLKRVGR